MDFQREGGRSGAVPTSHDFSAFNATDFIAIAGGQSIDFYGVNRSAMGAGKVIAAS
jgi:hypothetical protein